MPNKKIWLTKQQIEFIRALPFTIERSVAAIIENERGMITLNHTEGGGDMSQFAVKLSNEHIKRAGKMSLSRYIRGAIELLIEQLGGYDKAMSIAKVISKNDISLAIIGLLKGGNDA